MAIENVQSNTATDDPHRLGGVAVVPKNKGKRRRHQLDDAAKQRLHARLMNWYLQERDKQAENRYQMAIDCDFYDGLQWSEEDAQELLSRGQAPLVFNQVKPTINWLLGTERRTRIEGKVLPREEDDEKGAEVKNKLLKYLSDVNRTPFVRSEAWKSCLVAGLGWMEDAIETDPSKELLATRSVDWRQVYADSNGKQMDLDDARYLFRWSFLDIDVAEALCPDRAGALRSAAIDDNQVGMDEDDVWYLGARVNNASSGDFASVSRRGMSGSVVANGRERVKVIEAWYRVPVACKVCRSTDPDGRQFDGQDWDPLDADMASAYQDGVISVAGHVRMEMRVAIMTESVLLYEGKSPYKHNRFPLTPMWCYRRHRDNMPYGVIRDIRDAQIDYNKRASKALYILSTVRVIMDSGAVDDIEELRAEVARPDGIIVKNGTGKELRIDQDKALAEEHLKLMVFDGQMIRDVGGVTDQNLGKDEKGLSGQAIGKLQDQGSIVTAPLFDNMRLALQMQSEVQLSLAEQYYTAEKVIRIVGENRPIEWLRINQYDQGAGQYVNDITRSKADYVIGEQDFKQSIKQAMFESMMDLIAKLEPQVGLALLDMVIDFADVPNKDELVKRIRKLNGQGDPTRKPTPEEEQAQQTADAQAQEAKQIQMDTAKANLELAQAQVEKVLGDVQKQAAETKKIVAMAVEAGVKAAYEALQAAQIVATVPNVTPIADAVLAGAGYQDQAGEDPNLPAPSGALPDMTPQSLHGDYIGAAAGAPAGEVDPRQLELPELQQADGAAAGIETPANDGTTI